MTAGRLAWSLWGLAVALAAAALVLLVLNGSAQPADASGSATFDGFYVLTTLAFPTVGALIAARHPANAIGWLFCVVGLGAALEEALVGYATHALVKAPGSLPGGALAALVADAIWVPLLVVTLSLLFLLFPTGRPPSPRWQPYVWVLATVAATYVVATLLNPGPLYFFADVGNPLGLEAAGAAIQLVVDVSSGAAVPLILVSVVPLALRFRRSRGEERQQLKWLVYAAGALALSAPVQAVLLQGVRLGDVNVSDVIFYLLIVLVPATVGVAILRHRLYDIDVVINRTLVYGALTATLAGAYLSSVLLLQLTLSPLTEDSSLAVAGSTLAVAALFGPARARIQALVDRRFYRRRYDAARTLAAFGGRLRDEVDLEALSGDLRRVARETVQPAHVSLWLRSPG